MAESQNRGYCITILEGDGMGAVSSVVYPPQEVPPPITSNSKPQEGKRGAPYRFHGEGLVYDETSTRHEKEIEEQTKRDARDETRLYVEKIALFVGFFGLVGLLVTLYLTRVATNAAIEAVQAARTSAQADIASARAWIAFKMWKDVGVMKESRRFFGILVQKNVGTTPATNVSTKAGTFFVPGPALPGAEAWQPVFEGCPEEGVGDMGVVEANGEWVINIVGDQLTDEQMNMVQNREGRVFVHFCTTYRDLISPQEERITEGVFYWPPWHGLDLMMVYSEYFRMK